MDQNGRRLSITSEMSEGSSRPTSPVKGGMDGISEDGQDEVGVRTVILSSEVSRTWKSHCERRN